MRPQRNQGSAPSSASVVCFALGPTSSAVRGKLSRIALCADLQCAILSCNLTIPFPPAFPRRRPTPTAPNSAPRLTRTHTHTLRALGPLKLQTTNSLHSSCSLRLTAAFGFGRRVLHQTLRRNCNAPHIYRRPQPRPRRHAFLTSFITDSCAL